MKQLLTVKLKLNTTHEQFTALRKTQLAYRDALNMVSYYSFEHGKMSSPAGLQKGTYYEVRACFHLPSQMACSVMRDVSTVYKGLWTKVKKNAEHRKKNLTKKRYRGLDKPPTFVSPTLTYQYSKDYSFKVNQQVSVLTLDGRLVISYQGYDQHIAFLKETAEIGAAKLWYDKSHKQYYLLVSVKVEQADLPPEHYQQVIGVDVGLRYLAVTSNTQGTPTFFSGRSVRSSANHYARLRKRLQKKGTRSTTRRLIAISGRERRLKAQTNHMIARRILDKNPHTLIGVEHLTDIRERTRRRTHRYKKKGKGFERASTKQRKSNRTFSQWSFAELQSILTYKAFLSGSIVIQVDADNTSKGCPICGNISDENRPDKGLLFCCTNCHYTLHADLIGARNIVMRTLVIQYIWMTTGHLSIAPRSLDLDVSVVETKAARLKRYAELRWRPDTNPCVFGRNN